MNKTETKRTSGEAAASAYMTKTDPIWICVFIAIIVVNVWFGIHSLTQAQRVAMTRKNAEAVIAWLGEKAPLREQQQPVSAACDSPSGRWTDCLNAVVGTDGAIPNVRNELLPSAPVFADSCDRNDPQSLGAIVIEKGAPKSADPASIAYTKMPKDQDLSQKLLLKVLICGRSFHVMTVGETAF